MKIVKTHVNGGESAARQYAGIVSRESSSSLERINLRHYSSRYSNGSDDVETGEKRGGRIAVISSYPPQKCGIATFTEDLRDALLRTGDAVTVDVIAVAEDPEQVAYGPEVVWTIERNSWTSYEEAARFIDSRGYDAISLQHEFGLFGGPEGAYIVDMLRRLETPVVTTLHTLLAQPNPAYRTRTQELVNVSDTVVTLTPCGRRLLQQEYGTPAERIRVIPHGIPDLPFIMPEEAKGAWGFDDRTILLTFGLIGPSKGIEVMLDALPEIVERNPDVLYVIAGATHPGVIASQGERYRDGLKEQIERLGLRDNVQFVDRYLGDDDLHGLLQACDIYVTPYRNRDQISSGTLSYALGAGRALVSTPYWYAVDLLSGGRGRLVDFDCTGSFAREINRLIENDEERLRIYRRAYEYSRTMTWGVVAETCHELFGAFASRGERRGLAISSAR